MQLRTKRCKLDDLETGFKSGVALILLCEAISGEKITKRGYNKKPKMEVHMLENLGQAVKWLNTKVHLVGIGSRGIYEGDLKQILGLLWTLILRFQVQDVEIDGLSGKKGLLAWCRKNVKDVDSAVPVKNFTGSWKDGLALNALIAKFRPDLVDYAAIKALGSNEERVKNAFEVAEKHLDIPPLLDVEDLTSGRPDEKVVMLYISEFFKVFSKMMKAYGMIKGIKDAVDVTMRHDKYIEDYTEESTDIGGWIKGKHEAFGDESAVGVNEDEVKGLMEEFYKYCAEEKLEKRAQLFGLKGALAALHNSQTHNKRPAFVPAEGMDTETLEKAFEALADKEAAYEERLTETYKLFRRYRLLFKRLQAKATQVDDWGNDKKAGLADLDASLSSMGPLRPRAKIVRLNEEHDFLEQMQFERGQYEPIVAEMASIGAQIQAPSELAAPAAELVTKAEGLNSEFADMLAARLADNAAKLEKANEMKNIMAEFARGGNRFLFDMNGFIENLQEPCLDDTVEAIEKRIADVKAGFDKDLASQTALFNHLSATAGRLTDAGFGDVVEASPHSVTKLNARLEQFKEAGAEALAALEKQLEEEKTREEARKAFAFDANALRAALDKHSANLSMADHQDKSLEQQLEIIGKLKDDYASDETALNRLKDQHEKCQALNIVTNDHTPETYHSLVVLHGEIGKGFDRVASEIQASMDADQKLTPEQLKELRKAFAAFDEDKTGSLSLEQFHSSTTAMGIVLTKEQVKKKFAKSDKDESGNISFKEFVIMMEEELLHSSSKSDVLSAFEAVSEGDKKQCTFAQVEKHFAQPQLQFIVDGLGLIGGPDATGDFVEFTDDMFSR